MENVTRAIIIASGMLMFILGLSYSMYLINRLSTTSKTLIDTIDTVKYYDNLQVTSDNTKRSVSVDTIVSTLYRYYKESYQVKIVKNDGTVLQVFDTTLEGKVARAAAYAGDTSRPEYEIINNSIYNNPSNPAYMFEAPWNANIEEFAISRINFFLNGEKGYINNALIDYSGSSPTHIFLHDGGFLENYKEKTFKEEFVEYQYSGETISVEDGLETITGSSKEKNKILIIYTEE